MTSSKGTEGNPTTELKEFLTYMEETKQDNAKNESLKKIHGMVEQVKDSGKASVNVMKQGRTVFAVLPFGVKGL